MQEMNDVEPYTRAKRTTRIAVPAVSIAGCAVLTVGLALPIASATTKVRRVTKHGSSGVVITTTKNVRLGTILVSGKRTLYTLKPTKTPCTGLCTQIWPEVTLAKGVKKATAGAGVIASKLGVVTRPNGTRQVTYAGKPLYRFSGDGSAGSVKGNGLKDTWGTWSVDVTVKPKATQKSKTTSRSATTTTAGGYYGY